MMASPVVAAPSAEMSGMSAALREQVKEATEAWVALVAEAIAAEAPQVDARAAAERLTALVDGLSNRWLAGALDRERARELLAAAIDREVGG